jgi:hypothetical protein
LTGFNSAEELYREWNKRAEQLENVNITFLGNESTVVPCEGAVGVRRGNEGKLVEHLYMLVGYCCDH